MENIGTIAITAVVTLLVTVIAGLVVEYLKRVKPKLKYSIKESVPIILEGNNVGANVIEISNPSTKTVKDIVLKVRAVGVEIKNGGVNTVKGLDYSVKESGNELEVVIPFLKFKDYLSITTILEGKYSIPRRPDITVRSPDNFKLIEDVNNDSKKGSYLKDQLATPVVAIMVGISIISFFKIGNARTEQSSNLSIAAAFIGLPELSEKYLTSSGVSYYNQGPYVYSLAKSTSDKVLIKKYGDFLVQTINIALHINSSSESGICFFIGKIRLLQNKNVEAESWFEKSKNIDEDEFDFLSEQFENEKKL
jgi:hypothetical protein